MADAAHTATQQRIAAIHASSALHRDFDTNCNGINEPFEIAAYQARIEAGLRTPKPTRAATTASGRHRGCPAPIFAAKLPRQRCRHLRGGRMLRSVTVMQENLP